MAAEEKKVMRYYINIPKYDGLTKQECSKLWGSILRIINSVYADSKCFEVINTFDRVETIPDGVRNEKAYILGEELKMASKADTLVYINSQIAPYSLYSLITDTYECADNRIGCTIGIDPALVGLKYRLTSFQESLDEENKSSVVYYLDK